MNSRKPLIAFLLVLALAIPCSVLAEVKKEYYPSGKVKYEIHNYEDGKQIGKSYYENGNLRLELELKDGKWEGISNPPQE